MVKLQCLLTGLNSLLLWGRRNCYFTNLLKDFLEDADKKKDHFSLLYYHSFGFLASEQVPSSFLVFILKKKSDAVIVFAHTYRPKFFILHSVAQLMVCIPVAWVFHHILLLLKEGFADEAEQMAPPCIFCPLPGTICCSNSVLSKPQKLKEKSLPHFMGCGLSMMHCSVFSMIHLLKNYGH